MSSYAAGQIVGALLMITIVGLFVFKMVAGKK